MSSKVERLKTQLALVEAEAEFVEKKQSGTLTADDRASLRALREEYRLNVRQPVTDGAAPGPIGAKAEVN